jgi:hypothetical protein
MAVFKQPKVKNGNIGVAFSIAFIPVLIFYRENPGRRCNFPGTPQIRPKILPILALDDFFKR